MDNLNFLTQNLDLNQPKVRELLDKLGASGEKGKEITDKLLDQLRTLGNKVKRFTDEDKEKFSKGLNELLGKGKDKFFDKPAQNRVADYFIIFIIVIVIAFLGYKLYNYLRRNEKPKTK